MVEGPETKLFRVYPRDYWITAEYKRWHSTLVCDWNRSLRLT
jgi:hypothetical protein